MVNKLYFASHYQEEEKRAFDAIVKEKETVGYYNLPQQDISQYLEYVDKISDEIQSVIVIDMSGSSLGPKAVYHALRSTVMLKRRLYFLETTDPVEILDLLASIDIYKTHFLVVSKSGTTIETLAVYKYIYNIHPHKDSFTFITDENSPLEKYANELDAKYFNLPNNVGDRFSVLSSVGLLPLAFSGIDIESLLKGAKRVKDSFFDGGYMQGPLLKKAAFYATNHSTYNINCTFAYTQSLKYFSEWYVRLWGESLGKKQKNSAFHVGLTPVGSIGPRDQHSFLQLLTDGTRDKSVTFIKIKNFKDDLIIPNMSLPNIKSADIINNIPFNQLINLQCDSTIESLLNENDIPIDSIVLEKLDAYSMGSLLFYFELLTSLVAQMINVNAYDQPGIENGKNILKNKLKEIKG